MSDKTTIEWTDASWNFATGCTEVSPGCDNCYARTIAERFRGVRGHAYEQGFDLKLWPERLILPSLWKRPRRVFVNSMSDLFHKDIPDDFILQGFQVMASVPRHTYQILTKRPSRLANTNLLDKILSLFAQLNYSWLWPKHIWIGTSVESQEYDWRIDKLRDVPAPIRFISAEPLLGPLTLNLTGISWLIAGCESGYGARQMDEDWVRHLRNQCQASGTAFFYKQRLNKHGHKEPLPPIDGKVWKEFPDMEVIYEAVREEGQAD